MRKHILFIVENNPVPFDTRVWSEALVAKEEGYEVTVICPKHKKATKQFEVLDGIEIFRHSASKITKGTIGYVIEFLGAFFSEFYLSIKIYLNKPFQIIHGANPPDNMFLIGVAYKILKTKYIFDQHDLSPELYEAKFSKNSKLIYKVLMFQEKMSCKLADVIISSNNSYKEIIVRRHNVKPEKVFVVRNDPPLIKNTSIESNVEIVREDKEEEKKRRIKILYLGSINSQDGVEILLEALLMVINKEGRKNFICDIVGDGDALESVKRKAQEMNISSFVTFRGYLTDRIEIKKYLNSADICVEPAPDNEVNRHSTFIKIMEYMASGKPIVAFDLKETRYSTNSSAILVKTGDVNGFAKAIKRLMDEPELRKKLGRRGLERIERKLNWEKASSNLRKAYKSL